ncbi:hypothetical protein [Pseudoxanthomonas daejeonensis]|uniref:hypothetical protein n=1 Tax=Pseudoxanthomonas daejeonensis TaxID=266062 RepID=UPI001391E4F2|nr:hypothetical protein [Pseudoxanthomonas daejeonensis]
MKRLIPLLFLLPLVAHAQDNETTTLDTVVVTAPRPHDPFAFRNPVDYQPTRFDQHWQGTSAEAFGMQGGVVPWLNQKIAERVSKLAAKAGWKQQIQPAVARPSPLTDEQLERATR